jgi:uncharacterized protein (TIGR03085 family)
MGRMTRHAQSERQLLCDELERLGPEAPTLCEGWDTRDLAVHLHVRDARPHLVLGQHIPVLADRVERERRALGADYEGLLQKVRAGAPPWNPTSRAKVDETVNLLEYFVHHEDVRRAQPGWTPRELPDSLQRALWVSLRRAARLLFRRAATGVVLIAEGLGRRYAAKLPDTHGTVVLRGAPGELVLFAFGRGDVAKVEFSGDPVDIAALKASRFGV